MLKTKIVYKFALWLVFLIYIGLAYKSPFSARSLVPNLEPYPDSLYYSVPIWNFLKGSGFKMAYQGHQIPFVVPPLYGVILTPLFFVFGDIRVFYYTNLLLMLASIYFFLKVVSNIFTKEKYKKIYVLLAGFFLVTNFYFYQSPALLMAENLTIFLIVVGIYKLTTKSTMGLFWVSLLLYLTKYSNVPLSIMFGLMYLTRLKNDKSRVKNLTVSIVIGGITLVMLNKMGLFPPSVNSSGISAFSASYFFSNLKFYINSLLGGKTVYLWFTNYFLAKPLAISAMLGMVVGLCGKKYRQISFRLATFVVTLVIFMSFFYYPDLRYVSALLPILLIFFLLFVDFVLAKKSLVGFIMLCLLLGHYLLVYRPSGVDVALISFKKQIGINFIHSETPWNYLAIKNFEDAIDKTENAYMATFLPAVYGQLYTGDKFGYLPISRSQEFGEKGKDLISQLIGRSVADKYKEILLDGGHIYISDYYVANNLDNWRKDYQNLVSNFELEKVNSGCLGACDVYRVKLKP